MALIEREATKKALQEKVFSNYTDEFYGAMQEIDELPAINAASVVHGKWKRRKDGTPYCSACGANERDSCDAVIEECRYCYSCGTRMDVEED